MNSLNLNKGDVLNLSKGLVLDLIKSSSLEKLDIGLGWDTKCDLDSIAFLTDANGVIKDTVYFGSKRKQGIFLNGDNLTGAGDGDDEII
jgi:stress response protein SCP2